MGYLEVAIAILLVLLIVLALYVAVSWTLWRRQGLGKVSGNNVIYKHLSREEDEARTRLAEAFAQENMPKISITAVQPQPEFPTESFESAEVDDDVSESEHPDLGRLFFSLLYDPHRSVLVVRLARAEDIPIEPEASGTYVDVHLLPNNIQSETFEPFDTSISVSFRESYEFPLSKNELAMQTLGFQIVRYDRFSRRTSLGEVFLALAELGAQGIDLSREVFLCRNIISTQQILRTVGRKRLYPTDDEEENQERAGEQEMISRAHESDTRSAWQILRNYVRSGQYKSSFGLEAAMYWEPLFSPDASSAVGTGFHSASNSPSQRGFFFSGPGPPDASEEKGEPEGEESENDAVPSSSRPTEERPQLSSSSSQTSPLQISPAPDDYYKIVPITPAGRRNQTRVPSHSWQLPESFTSRDDDVVQTLAETYVEPRVVPSAPLSFQPGPPANKNTSFGSPSGQPKAPQRMAKVRKSLFSKGVSHKKGAVSGVPAKRLRTGLSSPRPKKMSPRRSPEGQADRGSSLQTKLKAKRSVEKSKRSRSPTKSYKVSTKKQGSSSASSSLADSSRASTELVETFPSRSGPLVLPTLERSFSSIESEEFRTPLASPFAEFGLSQRAHSDPNINTGHLRSLAETHESTRPVNSMSDMRQEPEKVERSGDV